MKLAVIWNFIAGDSRFAPIAVLVAIAFAVVLLRSNAPNSVLVATFPAVIALGLAVSVFERR